MKILFQNKGTASLPEIKAYIAYLNQDPAFEAYDEGLLADDYKLDDFDTIWEFKGLLGKKPEKQMLVHEYASLSTGQFPFVKNWLKKQLNPKPDLRIFLNENVHAGFPFKDGIDYTYRDMGIDEQFINVPQVQKEYDFVYVGAVSKLREIETFLRSFTKLKPGKLLVIGKIEDDEIWQEFKDESDIEFTGQVPYKDVPLLASKGIYGVNYMPDKYPYNEQTSTKLMEYLAMDLKVITTNYKWANDFQQKHGCKLYTLDRMEDFSLDGLADFEFVNHFQAADYMWDKVFEKAQIKEKLHNLTR